MAEIRRQHPIVNGPAQTCALRKSNDNNAQHRQQQPLHHASDQSNY